MGKNQEPLTVTLPCWQGQLSVDAASGLCFLTKRPPRKAPDVGLTMRLDLSRPQRQREGERCRLWSQETNKEESWQRV